MERKPDRKAETHARMRDAAGRGFRAHGFAGIGVDGIAKAAGVTSGAFYAHFGSKDGAFLQVLNDGLDQVLTNMPKRQREHGENWPTAFADYYLGAAHRADLACGCAMTTLSPEVVRADPEIREVYEDKMNRIVDIMAEGLAGGTLASRRRRAWAMLAVLIGGLTMARAVIGDDEAMEIAAAVKKAAIEAAGPAKGR